MIHLFFYHMLLWRTFNRCKLCYICRYNKIPVLLYFYFDVLHKQVLLLTPNFFFLHQSFIDLAHSQRHVSRLNSRYGWEQYCNCLQTHLHLTRLKYIRWLAHLWFFGRLHLHSQLFSSYFWLRLQSLAFTIHPAAHSVCSYIWTVLMDWK